MRHIQLVAFLLASSGFAALHSPVATEVAYGEHPRQRLDLYGAGEPGTARPVMVYVHGGGWRRGDKGRVHSKAEYFGRLGYLFVSVNYRLTPEVQHPGHAQDVAAAVAWVLGHAEEVGGDPGQVYLMGHSAGAHLAALVAAAPVYLGAHGKGPRDIAGVILLDGAGYDILMTRDRGPWLYDRLYRPAFGEDPEVLAEASPASYAAPGIAPHLIFHVDRRLGRLQSRAYAEALAESGVAVEVLELPSKSHRDVNVDLGVPGEPMNDVLDEFLARTR